MIVLVANMAIKCDFGRIFLAAALVRAFYQLAKSFFGLLNFHNSLDHGHMLGQLFQVFLGLKALVLTASPQGEKFLSYGFNLLVNFLSFPKSVDLAYWPL
jgi:hypothetical protein